MPPFEPTIRIQHEAFDPGEELRHLRAGHTDIGAVASFEGICRDHNTATLQQGEHSVEAIELEHYPGMTEQSILRLVVEAQQRWPLQAPASSIASVCRSRGISSCSRRWCLRIGMRLLRPAHS